MSKLSQQFSMLLMAQRKTAYGNFDLFNHVELPSAYQEVEYIESTGTQHFDLGIKGDLNTKAVIDFQLTKINIVQWIFGARTSQTSRQYNFVVGSNFAFATPLSEVSGSLSFIINDSAVNNDLIRHTFIKEFTAPRKMGLFDNNEVFASPSAEGDFVAFETPYNFVLFSSNNDGTINADKARTKCFKFELYKNNQKVRDLIPCFRKSDHKAGMYDLVNNKFYTNAGTGEFIIGANKFRQSITPFKFYKNNVLVGTYEGGDENVILNSLGDISDIYNNATGNITRKINKLSLETLNWSKSSSSYNDYVRFDADLPANKEAMETDGSSSTYYRGNGYCNKIDWTQISTFNNLDGIRNFICFNANGSDTGGTRVYCLIKKTQLTTLNEFELWLEDERPQLYYQLKNSQTENQPTVRIKKDIDKVLNSNDELMDFVSIDELNFSNTIIQGKTTPTTTGEKIITAGFTSGGEHFTQLYIYEDGEIWYVNDGSSAQAYTPDVGWEIEYKTIQFDSGVMLTDTERSALLNIYDKI